jgi:hypothetical protein
MIKQFQTSSKFPEHSWSGDEIRNLYPDALSLSEVLLRVEKTVGEMGEVVCEYEINGVTLSEAEEQRFAQTSAREIQILCVRSQKPLKLLDDSIVGCLEYIDKILLTLEDASKLFRLGDVHGAHECHRKCISASEVFVEMITHYKIAYQSLKGGLPPSWSALEISMLSTLTGIFEEYGKKNYILVADLLEYDLSNIYSSWKEELAGLERHGSSETKSEGAVC